MFNRLSPAIVPYMTHCVKFGGLQPGIPNISAFPIAEVAEGAEESHLPGANWGMLQAPRPRSQVMTRARDSLQAHGTCGIIWHIHPFENPDEHRLCEKVRFEEFLNATAFS